MAGTMPGVYQVTMVWVTNRDILPIVHKPLIAPWLELKIAYSSSDSRGVVHLVEATLSTQWLKIICAAVKALKLVS